MPSPGVADHTAGGYFLVRSAEGSPPWMPPELGVKRAISASSELVPIFPTPTWQRDFEVVAERFGLAPHERAAAGQVADDLFEASRLGWPNVFYELTDALEFCGRFAAARHDVVVIGVGLVAHHADAFLVGRTQSSGVAERLERREPLVDRGEVLGYEMLGMDVPPFESWAVSGLPAVAHRQLGVAVNDDGLITSFDEAARVAEIISGTEMPSEPCHWKPWLLVQYPVHRDGGPSSAA